MNPTKNIVIQDMPRYLRNGFIQLNMKSVTDNIANGNIISEVGDPHLMELDCIHGPIPVFDLRKPRKYKMPIHMFGKAWMRDAFSALTPRVVSAPTTGTRRIIQPRVTPEQKAMVREHLMLFCKFYSGMAEQIDEYVDLFPIHPAYIDTFQQMVIVEKREVLKTISQTIAGMIDQDVPQNEPGIVSYDSYWKRIKEDPAKRVDPSVAEVLRKSSVLEDIIQRSFTRPAYKPMAMKIIAALSVHRLTTVTLDAKLGLTAQNLKDDLCIYTEMPVQEAEFLQSTVETVLREIIKTVSGQFIEYNKENEQYYLDLKKDVDYDQKIEDRAGSLSDDRLDQYFYQLMWDCLDWHPQEYTTGHKIYQYNINWLDKNYFRRGYLFMGTSAERPTAQPPEDFYAYFLPPFSKSVVESEQKEDEVYLGCSRMMHL